MVDILPHDIGQGEPVLEGFVDAGVDAQMADDSEAGQDDDQIQDDQEYDSSLHARNSPRVIWKWERIIWRGPRPSGLVSPGEHPTPVPPGTRPRSAQVPADVPESSSL